MKKLIVALAMALALTAAASECSRLAPSGRPGPPLTLGVTPYAEVLY